MGVGGGTPCEGAIVKALPGEGVMPHMKLVAVGARYLLPTDGNRAGGGSCGQHGRGEASRIPYRPWDDFLGPG